MPGKNHKFLDREKRKKEGNYKFGKGAGKKSQVFRQSRVKEQWKEEKEGKKGGGREEGRKKGGKEGL